MFNFLDRSADLFSDRRDSEGPLSGPKRFSSGIAGASMVLTGLRRRNLRGWVMALSGADLLYYTLSGKHLYEFVIPSRSPHRDAPAFADGEQIHEEVVVERPAAELYALWRNFENLPHFMDHVKEVEVKGKKRSYWKVEGPLGVSVDWTAEVIADRKNELIGWRTRERNKVAHAGSVRFEPYRRPDRTRVTVKLQFNPPGGKAGATVAKWLGADPEQQVQEDLQRFKGFAEAMDLSALNEILNRKALPSASRA